MSGEQVAEISRRCGEIAMRWNIEMDRTLMRRDPVTRHWEDLLKGKRLSDDVGCPDYGDPHPTPGAAKVPEIIQGFLLQGRV